MVDHDLVMAKVGSIIDLKRLFDIVGKDIKDINDFIVSIFNKLGIKPD